MDNICHTLVGAALAEAGLKRRTALGSATLMIAANFPDIDVIAVPLGRSLGFRRGITHGIPALVILPLVLTLIMLAWHRWRGKGTAPDPRGVLLLSAIGMVTHPFLDWMNTYGMRWLMPFDGTWWYADTLFIVDPWVWIALGVGVWMSRRRDRSGVTTRSMVPARVALVVVSAYIATMGLASVSALGKVRAELATRGITADTVVVDPVFGSVVRRRVIYLWNGDYHFATYRLVPGKLSEPWFEIPVNVNDPAVATANRTAKAREYHTWTRLPYYVIERERDSTWVTIADARYTLDGSSSWAVTRIAVGVDGNRESGIGNRPAR